MGLVEAFRRPAAGKGAEWKGSRCQKALSSSSPARTANSESPPQREFACYRRATCKEVLALAGWSLKRRALMPGHALTSVIGTLRPSHLLTPQALRELNH